jgi:MFS family permease
MATALFIPFASPNVTSTVYDVTLPEVRSTALSVQYFLESSGAALAPTLAGLIADRSSLHSAILLICVAAWLVCALCFLIAAIVLPKDVALLRGQMRQRAAEEQALVDRPASVQADNSATSRPGLSVFD